MVREHSLPRKPFLLVGEFWWQGLSLPVEAKKSEPYRAEYSSSRLPSWSCMDAGAALWRRA